MRGAFVVQLRKVTQSGQLVGSVEEVDTGKLAKFFSDSELIGFLRERFAPAGQNDREQEGTNERNDNRH